MPTLGHDRRLARRVELLCMARQACEKLPETSNAIPLRRHSETLAMQALFGLHSSLTKAKVKSPPGVPEPALADTCFPIAAANDAPATHHQTPPAVYAMHAQGRSWLMAAADTSGGTRHSFAGFRRVCTFRIGL